MSSHCGEWHWVNRKNGQTHIWYCGSGRCEREACRKTWSIRRIAKICDIVKEYGLDKFFTLTLYRNLDIETAWEVIADIWRKMRLRLRRVANALGLTLKFVAVLEAHKDGYPHVHGFTNLYLNVKEWSRHWEESGGGKIVWVEKVRDIVKVGEYVNKQLAVAKYVGKQDLQNALKHLPSGKRTMWRSKETLTQYEVEKKENKKESEWELRRDNLETQYERSKLETTFSEVFKRCSAESIKKLAANGWKTFFGKTKEVKGTERKDQ